MRERERKKKKKKKHFLCTSNVKMHHSYYSMGLFQWHIATPPLPPSPRGKKNSFKKLN
jgi:hypothetical protein